MMHRPQAGVKIKVDDMNKSVLIFILQLLGFQLFGQHEQAEGHSLLLVPVFGFNYDYFFHNSWGIGLHNDLVLQQYKVEKHHDSEELVRENPVAICGIISYKPHHRWTLLGGYGVELEKNENINLFRFGLEYGIPLKDHWELGFNIEYDYKIKAYSSILFGVVFSKLLFRKSE
jgi:hypothetical protein